MEYTDYRFFNFSKLERKLPVSNKRMSYYPDFACFDIETTGVTEKDRRFAFVYLWQLNLFGEVIIGRTLDTFKAFIESVLVRIDNNLVIYAHNLSYEFQWLKSYFEFDNILATNERKIISARSGRIEWRCSLKLSNMSLKVFAEKWGGGELKDEKIDYSVYRSSTETLPPHVIHYAIMDVVAQRASILNRMKADNDDLASIPLTATGYVRRSVRKTVGYWGMKNMQVPMSETVYMLLSEAFRGGNTHANRYYTGQIIKNVRCFDESSAYPHAQCSGDYPTGEFMRTLCGNVHEFERKIIRSCALIRMVVRGVRLRNPFDGFPPMSVSKCWFKRDVDIDNGRVLAAGAIGVTLTDIDYNIFASHYTWKSADIECVYLSRRRKLPDDLISAIYTFYKAKTEFKDVDGKEVEYMRAKEDNNSVYGMSAQKPIFGDYVLNGGILEYRAKDIMEALEQDAKRRIMPYQYGVWVTANARKNLEVGIKEDTIYVDTDSTYTDRKRNIFTKYNAELEEYYRGRDMIPYDKKGRPQVLGSFQEEPYIYDEFITWGSKKYAGMVDGKLRITIAGVPKKDGAKQLVRDGGLTAFKPGYVFDCECNSAATYNDDMDIMYKGEHILSNMHIHKTPYKLGISDDYTYVLDMLGKEYTGHVL